MKPLFSLISTSVLCIMLTACDTQVVKDDEKNTYANHSIESTKSLESQRKSLIEAISEEMASEALEDWEPYMIKTPTSQPHKPFNLPKSNIEKIKTYFYDDVITNESTIKSLIDNDIIFEGYVSNSDSTMFHYSFQKQDENYFSKNFALSGNYQLRQKLTGTYKNTVYKMLEVSGVDNPEKLLQELLASPKITKYTGCIVQQKPVKYGLIDLTSCKEDDATVLALYNPAPMQ